MTVKDLIVELLEFPSDYEVDVEVDCEFEDGVHLAEVTGTKTNKYIQDRKVTICSKE